MATHYTRRGIRCPKCRAADNSFIIHPRRPVALMVSYPESGDTVVQLASGGYAGEPDDEMRCFTCGWEGSRRECDEYLSPGQPPGGAAHREGRG